VISLRTLGRWRALLALPALALAIAAAASAAERIPPAPAAHFNDYAGVTSPGVAQELDRQLADFERSTSNQVVVAIFPTMESDSSVEDYTVRVAQAWHAGLKGRDNGAVLFVFTQSHQIRLQVGYGLEPVLTDALAKRIISDEITPRFRSGDYNGGLTAGVAAIIAATRGEYKGTGSTVADGGQRNATSWIVPAAFILFFLIAIVGRLQGSVYSGGGHGFVSGMLTAMLLSGGGRRGGFGGGGGGFGGGGGGFSGGGGGFGGGGAGGSW
jgi:uncharacterized protein